MTSMRRVRPICPPPLPESTAANRKQLLPSIDQDLNLVLVTGVIAEEPRREERDGGNSVTLLRVTFVASRGPTGDGLASCEVKVNDDMAEPHRQDLEVGQRIGVVGKLTGPEGVWAMEIVTPGSEHPR